MSNPLSPDPTPFQRFVAHLASSLLLDENMGDIKDTVERLLRFAGLSDIDLDENVHDQLERAVGLTDIGIYSNDCSDAVARLRGEPDR